MLRRFVRWLLGIPSPDQFDASRELDRERAAGRTGAVAEASRSNMTGGKGLGPGGRDWTEWKG